MAPEKVENILVQSNYIQQIMVYGHSLESVCVAILVPSKDALGQWCQDNGKDMATVFQTQDADFIKLLIEEINQLGTLRKLNSLEKPKALYITDQEFSPANDILTPTFKLKRNVCKKVYEEQINTLYADLNAKFAAAAAAAK